MRAGIRPRTSRAARRKLRLALSALLLGAALAIAAALVAFAAETLPGPVAASVVRVIDGDTFRARVHIWLGQEIDARVRVRGIDTPEMTGRCEAESLAAKAARDFAVALLPPGGAVRLRRIGADKYAGRVDAEVELPDGRDLAAVLIAAGHARAYAGGKRRGWCP